MSKEKINKNTELMDDKLMCVHCGKIKKYSNSINYYLANDTSVYRGLGKIPVCKDCLNEIYDNYYKIHKNIKKALYYSCRKVDIYFCEKYFESAMKDHEKSGNNIWGLYISKVNSLGRFNDGDYCFDNSDSIDGSSSSKRRNPKSQNHKEQEVKIENLDENSPEYNLNDNDSKIKNDVIRLLGSDPFAGYSKYDQKILYNGLIGYLDEDTLEDQFKIGIYIQILNMELQVKKIDYNISQITKDLDSLLANSDKLKSLTGLKKDIIDTANKIAKENSISVKNRDNQKAGKSTLGYMMNNLRELNFDEAEVDYYSQKMCLAMEKMAGMSVKAIQENLLFDENDINEMFQLQREKITNQEKQILKIEEELRQAYKKIEELENIERS